MHVKLMLDECYPADDEKTKQPRGEICSYCIVFHYKDGEGDEGEEGQGWEASVFFQTRDREISFCQTRPFSFFCCSYIRIYIKTRQNVPISFIWRPSTPRTNEITTIFVFL